MNKDLRPNISVLYPDLTPEEQEEAANNLKQYLDLVKRIHDRLEREGRLHEINNLRLLHEWNKRSEEGEY